MLRLWASALVLTLTSCASLSLGPAALPPAERSGGFRSQVVAQARSLLGRGPDSRVTVRGREFVLDCIGTVSAAFWGAGADVRKDFGRFGGNGVTRLYHSLEERGVLSRSRAARPGDIVLWDNTWDANEDGVFGNDGHTHAGIVVEVEADGTLTYLHEDYLKGVVLASMNLDRPGAYRDGNGKVINTPLYMGSAPGRRSNPPRFLSGDLWSGFGAPEIYQVD